MFSRILIANRGEIALRVIRACKELGIETVAIYSEADRDAIYLRHADQSICIGPPQAAKSYLDIARIISAAEISDVDAIHPGYGFLSENSHFAEVCRSCRIGFIGPPPEASRLVGNKASARALAKKIGIPLLPGSEKILTSEDDALKGAHAIGYPVMIKAAAGGGGRGMRLAHNDISLVNGFLAAQAEAEAAFKDPSVYLEKFLQRPRHVEIQILADTKGNVLHLGERDCSIQRRHQKLVEESPCPVLSPETRRRMGEAAIALAREAGYVNAGTVEFLLDTDGRFYFIEMNARIQVEHPVTEMVTGIDLVKEQIRIAAGEKLAFTQEDVRLEGCAIECRINAEDPAENFRPCPGKIGTYFPPGGRGVRVDSHAYSGYSIPPHYDSMIAKLIVHARTRAETINVMSRCLQEYIVEGIKTTLPLHAKIMADRRFIEGNLDTTFLDSLLP
ncbi:MAG: acetyl-CoA carboxylase biotin carboxylase subunit [Planctomycetes bacterium]|nr:acetyl-CoA carboxylase biotin carboxylase subunit [Planctomycetota bacterium]